ncbi:phosphate ABC transporter substrate-binding protein, PhoT family [Pseudomonas sp. NFPP07]|uniref:substrate-binding domain-containing protein n=1 Tax=Pseudomonas sp. NFPP07 TaxID=1566213 RepID=UPI0008E49419|nr:substrate-binding domain-containing protein [Pseudomonas sp. NFPP07]SFQ22875.1 phosphate ABC transporter substrate-binding protein, PhoT family [Pseudomonas sp. NFPP07]
MSRHSLFATVLVLASLCSQPAMAAVIGGGSSSPLRLYTGTPALLPADFSYIGIGGGDEKAAFLTNAPVLLGLPLATSVDFAGSESLLTAGELQTYNSTQSASYGPLIQIPVAGMALAIPYKKSGTSTLQLTAAQLCDIFSGAVSTWGAVLGNADTMPIKVIYRSGSSGSTELFTRFLNDSCPGRISVSSLFTQAGFAPLPNHWQAVAGSADVVAAINAGEGTIGYVASEYLAPHNNATSARVSKLPMAAGTAPLPTVANTRYALGYFPPPMTAMDRANPLKWVPFFGYGAGGQMPVPTQGNQYPIVGYTNLLIGQCYRDAADVQALRGFLGELYSLAKAPTIYQHFFVTVPQTASQMSGLAGEIRKVFLDNAYGDNLDIGNVNVCHGIGRP